MPPPRRPQEVLRAIGSRVADQRSEPPTEPDTGDAPEGMSSEAVVFWFQLLPVVEAMRVMTKGDRHALRLTCEALAEYDHAAAVLRKEGLTYVATTAVGSKRITSRPEIAVRSDSWKRAMTGLIHFGLSPDSRTKVAPVNEIDDDPTNFQLPEGATG